MATRDCITFYLNGELVELSASAEGSKPGAIKNLAVGQSSAAAGMMLADYLRQVRGLPGTKIVCAEGDCGACTVLVRSGRAKNPGFVPLNACIQPVALLDGSSIVSVDALARERSLTPVQAAMVSAHGSQCGFCTPGFVMALTGLVEKRKPQGCAKLTETDAKNALTGNLCRCTGYQPIIDAATAIDLEQCEPVASRFSSPKQDAHLKKLRKTGLVFNGNGFSIFAPTELSEAARYLAKHRDARLISGATDLGVFHTKRKIRLEKLVSLHLIDELFKVRATGRRLRVGARVTLTELRAAVKKPIPELARFLDLFASPQIRAVATMVGNLGNASPIADLPPFLLVSNTVLHVIGPRSQRELPLTEFYLGYRKTSLRPGELIAAVEFDIPQASERLSLFKASQRRDLDISAVNAAFRAKFKDAGRKHLGELRIAYGGIAATPIRLLKTEAALAHGELSPEALQRAVTIMQSEIAPIADLRGSATYRRVVAENFLLRYFREASASPAAAHSASPEADAEASSTEATLS